MLTTVSVGFPAHISTVDWSRETVPVECRIDVVVDGEGAYGTANKQDLVTMLRKGDASRGRYMFDSAKLVDWRGDIRQGG